MRSATALLGLFVVGSLAFNACGGDDGDDDSTSGSGGTAGKGGSSAGRGGSNAGEGGESAATTGGKGGKGGRGGKGGQGGSTGATGGASSGRGGTGANGGTGAEGGTTSLGGIGGETSGSSGSGEDSAGGTVGLGGSGGSSGGTAGLTGASGAGAGGEGGAEAGAGGTGPAPTAKACAYECDGDEDCNPGAGIVCIEGECLDETRACETNEACVAWLNNMFEDCNTDTDCYYYASYGDVCVDVGGFGRCAMIPYPDCAFGEPNDLPRFGASGTANVCAALSGRCENHECYNGCTSEADFCATRDEGGPACNEVTGHCGGCTVDDDCDGVPGAPHCNVSTGTCQCQGLTDCAGVLGLPSCVAGECSCSSEESCTKFPNATASCR